MMLIDSIATNIGAIKQLTKEWEQGFQPEY